MFAGYWTPILIVDRVDSNRMVSIAGSVDLMEVQETFGKDSDRPTIENRLAKKATATQGTEENQEKRCLFCRESHESELLCGELKSDKKGTIAVHYFCLLFASDLEQKRHFDEVTDPLGGFGLRAIERRKIGAKNQKCVFCGRNGATVKCASKACKVRFHLPCGRRNDTFHKFYDTFDSCCLDHLPPTTATTAYKKSDIANLQDPCVVCREFFEEADGLRAIVVSTCCPKATFHWACIQNMASEEGKHHLRCPLCRNVETFQNDMLGSGIYIPDRDAGRERDRQYDDLLIRPSTCSAAPCLCPRGSEWQADEDDDENEEWHLFVCDTCGGKACHVACFSETVSASTSSSFSTPGSWTCSECSKMICSASSCKCPKGRKWAAGEDGEEGGNREWRLVYCGICDARGCHIGCMEAKRSSGTTSWRCTPCTTLIKMDPDPVPISTPKRRLLREPVGQRRSKPRLDPRIVLQAPITISSDDDTDDEPIIMEISSNRSIRSDRSDQSVGYQRKRSEVSKSISAPNLSKLAKSGSIVAQPNGMDEGGDNRGEPSTSDGRGSDKINMIDCASTDGDIEVEEDIILIEDSPTTSANTTIDLDDDIIEVIEEVPVSPDRRFRKEIATLPKGTKIYRIFHVDE